MRILRALARSESGTYPFRERWHYRLIKQSPPGLWAATYSMGPGRGGATLHHPPRTEGVVSVAVRRGELKVVTPERSKGVAQEAMKKLLFQVKVDRKLGHLRAGGRAGGRGGQVGVLVRHHWGGRGEE